MIGSQIYTFQVNCDVTSIIIKNAESFSYLTASLNALIFDLSLLSKDDIGTHEVII